ncbi:MAG: ATP synthase F1 subunit gamma [Clostridiales bacterium]|jgi:F-type H+-transporting ATPase subunit gamma|nr:ATP synthase F1 subunit gamma [Clostridiales bacterium]
MASMRDLRIRIKSVKSTQQITKAMNLVAASKLQRAKQKALSTRPYFNAVSDVLRDLALKSGSANNQFLKERPVNSSLLIVIAGDKGLCGGYNTNVCRAGREFFRKKKEQKYLTVGNRARDFFRRRKKNIIESYTGISENPFYEDAAKLGERAFEMFKKGEVDEVYIAYTEFNSVLTHTPKVKRVLPIDPGKIEGGDENSGKAVSIMRYDPGEDEVLAYIIPKYINNVIYGAMCESAACQLGARMTAMDSATKNASEMIEKYTTQYNRARQGAITQEITEIVSGANALE